MSTDDTPQDLTPDLRKIAFEAEQQCADVVALVDRLIAAYEDDEPEVQRILQTIARLLAPIHDHLETLVWELPRPAQPTAEEG